ncbi:MAG TPA: cation diffusion facilitator family transporter [Longimicrobiales bacterium]|nr:cation diffusion facilitator family transporter [Longimicrobiales bacterium]
MPVPDDAETVPKSGHPTPIQLDAAIRSGTRTALWTVFASAILALIKISAGVAGNAYALVADGVESLTDVVSSLVVLGGLRLSRRSGGEDFPYGLGKVESLAAAVVATLVLAAGFGIAVQAVREIREPHGAPAAFTLWVLAAVVVVKEVLFRVVAHRAGKTGSRLLDADAWHHRSDAITSLAAFIGISVALVGGPRLAAADEWAALLACGVILWNGGRLFRHSIRDVLDAAAPVEIRDRVRALSLAIPGVADVEELRVRRSGLAWLVDIHVEVDPDSTVRAGHEVAHRVKEALVLSELPILDVLVHIEPHEPREVEP